MPQTDVTNPWTDGVGVRDLTDTDLEASRVKSTRVSDPEYELHRFVETLRRHWGLDNWSQTIDRAVRVELAHAIDFYGVSFSRGDFDVAYTIPPLGYVDDVEYSRLDLVDESAVDTDDRTIGASVPPVVFAMMQAALAEGYAETLSGFVKQAVRRQCGHNVE